VKAAVRSFALATLLAIGAATPANAGDPVYTNWRGLALSGYDAVAYFREGKPIEGSGEHELEYLGATWRFASAENLALFRATPEKFAPQYGGYCAWAVSQGHTASGDPQFWKVVGGKLYLNYDADVQKKWLADIPGFIELADRNWPAVLGQ